MSFLSSLGGVFGLGGGKGGNFNAQSAAPIQGVQQSQTNNSYNQSQLGLDQQAAFMQALQAQNGLLNQQNVFGQQQDLANQFQGVANGTGPNPALAQLNNTTGQNIASQAALMAGQRGAGANTGLLARQMGMQGGNIEQQAVGQGAALQAQQQLNAMNSLQQQQGQMANLAGAQVGQQANAITGYNQAAQSEQGNLLGGLSNYNNANVANAAQQNSANAAVQGKTAGVAGQLVGGLLNSAGGAAAAAAHGGIVKNYAQGGAVGPQSMAGRFLYSSAPDSMSASSISTPPPVSIDDSTAPGYDTGQFAGKKLKSMFSSPQNNTDLSQIQPGFSPGMQQAKGGPINGEALASEGKKVPGKANVKGDSLKNDKVPAVLSPGEVVIPRSVMQSEDPVKNTAKFVAAIMAKQNIGRKK